MTLDELLNSIGACAEARRWARGKTLDECWRTCEKPDWMLFLGIGMAGRTGWPGMTDVMLTSVACARAVEELGGFKAIECVRDSGSWILDPSQERLDKLRKSNDSALVERGLHQHKMFEELDKRNIAGATKEKAALYALDAAMNCADLAGSTARLVVNALALSEGRQRAATVVCEIVRNSLSVPVFDELELATDERRSR